MRIIGHIEHPQLKVTLFKMDNKFSVKLESGVYEQTYKFRQSKDLETTEDLKKLIDPEFIESVLLEINRMHQIRTKAFNRYLPATEADEFETII